MAGRFSAPGEDGKQRAGELLDLLGLHFGQCVQKLKGAGGDFASFH